MKKGLSKSPSIYSLSACGVSANYITTLDSDDERNVENGISTISKDIDDSTKKSEDTNENENCDFETAIKATGCGKFNCLLFLLSAWGFMANMNATTAMSLILPSAECDLNLSNFDKGVLNSVVFIGMTISAFFWGLLSDAVGRKNVLVIGYGLDAFFSTLVGLAQNFPVLLISKIFAGFVISGPMSVLRSYLAEHHSNIYRGSIVIYTGIFSAAATVIAPALAWLIIPRNIRLHFFNGYIFLPSWRIFLLASAIPSFLAFISLLFFDESPKFLMFQGNNEEALRVMKKIYKMNYGKPKSTFPVKSLKNEMGSDQKNLRKGNFSMKKIISTGWKQMVPIFQKTYLPVAALPCMIQMFTLFGVNTIRLWSPQLFASAINTEKYGYNSTAATICELLGTRPDATSAEEILRCTGKPVDDQVYFNSMITGFVTGIGYLISGYIVKSLEKKWLMLLGYLLSIACCFGLYWSSTSNILLAVISLFIAFTSASATALMSAVIDIFPTSLRTTAVSLTMSFGRTGALIGNLTFPLLLDMNCTIPFIALGIVLLVAASLTTLLPNVKGKNLE